MILKIGSNIQECHCEESRQRRDDEAILKRDCFALRARNDVYRGFTLVELLLSVVILGFGLCIVLQSYLSSLHGLDASQNYLEAVRFAKEKLDDLTIAAYENNGLTPEVKTGEAILGLREFNWESEVSEIQDPAYLSEDLAVASVNIHWRQRNIARSCGLATYLPKKKEEKKEE